MKILIVEDEIRVSEFIAQSLQHEGYSTEKIQSWAELSEYICNPLFNSDLIILDRNLHHKDSIELIPEIRKKHPFVKILVLSAISDARQKAFALDQGADDYLGKPFSLEELQARIRVLGRRTTGRQLEAHIVRYRQLIIDKLSHKVTIQGVPVDLSAKEYLLLLTFVESPGRVFNKFQLLDKVWNTQFDIESNIVESTIKNLRKKLSEHSLEIEISSKRNVGYWIES